VSPTQNRKGRRATLRPVQPTNAAQTAIPAVVVVCGTDKTLCALATEAGTANWNVESCPDAVSVRTRLSEAAPQLIVIDDEAVTTDDRGWLLERIRRLAPRAYVIYVAARHDAETEKRARSHGVHYYMSKPIDPHRFTEVSQAFMRAAR
jgi:DNA-binding response OmpR family regulator